MQFHRPLTSLLSAFAVAALLCWSGCAAKPAQPVGDDGISDRSGRAFADLQAHEQGRRVDVAPDRSGPHSMRSAPEAAGDKKPVPVESGRRPAWVDGESRRFPSGAYLTGVGYGADRPEAEDQARAAIAKIFTSHVESSNRTYQQIFESSAGGKSHSAQNINFEEITRVSTQKVLSGARIVHVYRDSSATPEYYALAVVDRSHAADILREKIVEMDRQIEQSLRESQVRTDKLTQIKLLHNCIELHALRQAYNAELRIVDLGGQGIAAEMNISEIKARLTGVLLKDFLIALSVQGSRADEVRQSLVEALNSKGFAVSEQIDNASVLARGRVDIKPMPQGSGPWKFVRWNAYFDLVDRSGGAVFGSVQKTGKSGHLTTAQAEDRAVKSIRQSLAAEISEDLSSYILRQSR